MLATTSSRQSITAPDSTTTKASPRFTGSPGDFNQLTIFPSVIVDDNAGMNTSLTAFIGTTGLLDETLPREEGRATPVPTLDFKFPALVGAIILAML